ncbi:uncharacterized protein LOC122242196 [Penaeus japonicus]|uniref:uncharacterized protein LOC122242196 n=1 Tax=Penaeus japonicus TaxID=27405 RepID=UPI001C71466D|nr:uncharacterized protein LOC122242196 [Penaeus japonicus]
MKVLLLLANVVATSWARRVHSLPGGFGSLSSSFACHERIFGYYADVENDCRAYHVCYPVYTENGALLDVAHFSFMCGMGLMSFSKTPSLALTGMGLFLQESVKKKHADKEAQCEQVCGIEGRVKRRARGEGDGCVAGGNNLDQYGDCDPRHPREF